jgi:Flp pilus assembly protein CpaB
VAFRHSRGIESPRPIAHRILGRHRTRWMLTTFIALVAVFWTISTVSGAERESHAWGSRRVVAVARRDLAPGDVVSDDSIEWTARPAVMLPTDTAANPVGRTVTRPIAAGEILLDRRLSGGSSTGPSSILGTDDLAFAVPVDPSTPTVAIGDMVDAFTPGDPAGSGTARSASATATRIARHATVVSVSETRVMIAVDTTQAPALARALLDSSVVLALSG